MPLLQDVPLIKMADKPPSRVPGHVERVPTPLTSPTEKNEFHAPHKLSEEEARELDQECFERFIKVNAKHITDGQVSGSLGQGELEWIKNIIVLHTKSVMIIKK